jgi:hypothetical protein
VCGLGSDSTFHGGPCSAFYEAHTNFADESTCLMADNFRNEIVTIHRSQEVLKMLSFLHLDIFRNYLFL